MKFIYKILILGMVCLISSATYAQIEQYSDDGTSGCIDCESKTIETRGCLCSQLFHFQSFNIAIPIDNTKEEWLHGQENLLKTAMSGLPTESFTDVQRKYFKREETNKLALDYVTSLRNSIAAVENYDEATLFSSTANANILDVRKRVGTTSPTYGDLKYKGQFLKNMTDTEVNSRLSVELVTRNNQRGAASEYGIRESRLQRMQFDGYISNFLAGNLVVHYNHLDYEPAIRFMTTYMIRNATNNQGVPYNLPNPVTFLDENSDYTLAANRQQHLQTLLFRTGASGQPTMPGYTPPSFGSTPSDDVVLFNYVLRSIPTQTNTFINGSGKENVKGEYKKYLEGNQYNSESLQLSEDVFNSYANNTPFPHNQYTYSQDTGLISSFGFLGSPDDPNGAFYVGNPNADQLQRFYGLGNMLSDLSRLPNARGEYIGSFFKEILFDHGYDLSTAFSDQELFDVFQFVDYDYNGIARQEIRVEFRDNIGAILLQNDLRLPSMLQIPYAVEGALALARGETFDFAFRKKVYDIAQALNLNPAQQDWYINHPIETGLMSDYLGANNNVVNAFAGLADQAYRSGGTVYFDDEIIYDPSTRICTTNILDRLRLKDNHGSINPDITNGGTNHLSSFILGIFDENPVYNVTFMEEQLGVDADGNDKNGTTTLNNGDRNSYLIKIDTDLVNEGTQLFIAKTLIHESMHAFLLYNIHYRPDTPTPPIPGNIRDLLNGLFRKYKDESNVNNLIQHEFIGQYVEGLANSLAAWDFHKQPIDYYRKLSWGGLEETSAYKALTTTQKTEIQNIIKNERFAKSAAKGEKCP